MSQPAWTLVSTTWLIDHPYAALVEDVYEMPNGTRVQWARHADEREGRPTPVVAGAICRRENGDVLVAQQWNPGPQAVVDEFPGGGGDPGESPEACVRRELQEEVGLYPHRLEHLGVLLHDVRRHGIPFHIFVATELEERWLDGDANEFIDVSWHRPSEIDAGIATGRFCNGVMLAAWALYRARYPVNQRTWSRILRRR